jgi:predicted transcriptional regulator
MSAPGIKDEARRLVDKLPENASWDDLMYEIYVRQAIERGLADSNAGRTTPMEEVGDGSRAFQGPVSKHATFAPSRSDG